MSRRHPAVHIAIALGAVVILACTGACEAPSSTRESSPANQRPGAPTGSAPKADCKLSVFAASSLRDLTDAVLVPFMKHHPGCAVEKSFGGSNKLGQQIEAGATFDVFLSAAKAPVDSVIAAGKAQASSRAALFSNQLVLISHQRDPVKVPVGCGLQQAPFKHLVLGQPDAVPAGIYAREYLSAIKCPGVDPGVKSSLWEKIQDRLLPMPEVRAVLSVVQQQPGTLGFVYRTDVSGAAGVVVQYVVDGPLAPKIDYYGVLKASPSPFAEEFYSSFRSKEGRAIVTRMGFIVGGT